MKKFKFSIYLLIPLLAIFMVTGCDKQGPDSEDYYDLDGYSITLNADKAPGHGQYQKSVESSDPLDITVQVNSLSDLKTLSITKTVNLSADPTFGENGVMTVDASGKEFTYNFHYNPSVDDVDQLIGFTFQATTVDGLTETSDLTAKVTLSPKDNLVRRRWNWQSILHVNDMDQPNVESIKDCEKDNFYLFNADGTMSLNYGSDTGTGDCVFDGFTEYDSWKLTDDEKYFIIKSHGIFTPNVTKVDTFTVKKLTVETLQLEETVDLSAFGGRTDEVFLYTFKAAPRD